MATEDKEKKESKDEAPEFGPVAGTKEFDEKVKAGESIHSPDPTGKSPTTVQLEEQEKGKGNGQK